MARKKKEAAPERPKKRTNKELAMGMIYNALTNSAFDAEDAKEHAVEHGMTIRDEKSAKIATQANDILNRLVERRVKRYLEARGDDMSKPTPLSEAAPKT